MHRAEGGTNFFGVFCVKNHDFMPKNHIFFNCREKHENFGVFRVKNHDFTPKFFFFFNFRGGECPPPPPNDHPIPVVRSDWPYNNLATKAPMILSYVTITHQKCSGFLLVTRFPVQLWAISWATTSAKDLSPACKQKMTQIL